MQASQTADRFTPIYLQIQEGLRQRIASGELRVGDRVPSDTELAEAFQTTRATVRQALSRLVFEGLIIRQVGRGSYVAPRSTIASPIDTDSVRSFEEQVALSGRHVTYRLVSDTQVRADKDVARWLERDPGVALRRIARVRAIEDRPICLDIRYIPDPYGPAITTEMLAHRSMHQIMSDIIGARVPTILVTVTAEAANTATAALLELKRGAPLLVREHAYFDHRSDPVLYGRALYRGDVGLSYRMDQTRRGGGGGFGASRWRAAAICV
ncbi:MAG: GntR family transcriptional regulator [Acetobacteraceae bacterium]